jgi:FkbM family methyltransferase
MDFEQITSPLKRIVAMALGFFALVATLRNWHLVLLTRISPFAKREKEVLAETRDGLRCILRPKKGELSILNEVLYHKIYTEQFPINGVVVDIGAHVGLFTIYAASRSEKVLCYEPDPHNSEVLKRNVELNSLKNVKIFQQAVGDRTGTRKLSVCATKSYGHTLCQSDASDLAGTIDVESTTLQDILISNGLKRIDFLKVHCEGAEREIFSHAPKEVLEKVSSVVIKCSSSNREELVELLLKHGFRVICGDRRTIFAKRDVRAKTGSTRQQGPAYASPIRRRAVSQ